MSDRPTPEITVTESASATLADLADLARELPGDAAANARTADKLSEELAELSQMIRSLPARPVAMSGHDFQILSGLRTAHAAGEDVAETIARACAHLAWELGSVTAVLANRSGSWEASHIYGLLTGTVGEDGDGLDDYRVTQP